jgi:hypothetical protein
LKKFIENLREHLNIKRKSNLAFSTQKMSLIKPELAKKRSSDDDIHGEIIKKSKVTVDSDVEPTTSQENKDHREADSVNSVHIVLAIRLIAYFNRNSISERFRFQL